MATMEPRSESITGKTKHETLIETTLRPLKLTDFIGQDKMKTQLSISIAAAKQRKEPLDHVLVTGGAGLGKTSIATIIANEMGSRLFIVHATAIGKATDLATVFNHLNDNDVLFIDEIHRLSRSAEEFLHPAMEDFFITTPSEGAVKISPFTMIGATVKQGSVSPPLRDRFGHQFHLMYYSLEDVTEIIKRSAAILQMKMHPAAAGAIALRSRKTPRVANRLLKRVRDYAQVKKLGVITADIASKALDVLDVDKYGFDQMDRSILKAIIEQFGGGPVGLDSLASAIGEDAGTLYDVYEPYLMQSGYLIRTSRGRLATKAAFDLFKKDHYIRSARYS